jgi:hypothetical protein
MTYYTAVQPMLLLRALHITTKAISRRGGWGRIFGRGTGSRTLALSVGD